MSYYETERDERVISALKEISSQLVNIKKAIESTDVVPVVRCKDCRYKGWVQEPCHGKSIDWCKLHDICIKETDYCSYGERKD